VRVELSLTRLDETTPVLGASPASADERSDWLLDPLGVRLNGMTEREARNYIEGLAELAA